MERGTCSIFTHRINCASIWRRKKMSQPFKKNSGSFILIWRTESDLVVGAPCWFVFSSPNPTLCWLRRARKQSAAFSMRDRSSGSSSSFPPHHCNPLLSLKNKTSQELRRSPIELFWTAKKQTFTCVCAFVEILQISHNIQDNFPSAVVKKTFNPVVFINFKIALFASTRFGCLGVAPCVTLCLSSWSGDLFVHPDSPYCLICTIQCLSFACLRGLWYLFVYAGSPK